MGDILAVTGLLGGSMEDGRHLRPEPRLAEGAWFAAQDGVHAMMDLSDGLPATCDACQSRVKLDWCSIPIKSPCIHQSSRTPIHIVERHAMVKILNY